MDRRPISEVFAEIRAEYGPAFDEYFRESFPAPSESAKYAMELADVLIALVRPYGGTGIEDQRQRFAALIQSSFEAWKEASGSEVTEGYWWCPECEEEVASTRVTFQECHDTCGRHVIWKEPIASRQSAEKTVPMELLRRISYYAAARQEQASDGTLRDYAGAYGYTVTESAKTVPMEMLIAVRQDVPVCATRDQLRRIAAKYGYKVEEKP